MKASDYISEFFVEKGVKVIFGYIGGMVTHVIDSMCNNNNLKFIQTYHEQTAAIAAEGYALESGTIGVAVATSGPGATNLITGIADAYFGSIPVVYITGQVNSYEYKYSKCIRQQGFQETDVVSIVKPITKYSVLVDDVHSLRYELEKAYHIAMSGRKGPVLLDITMDVTRAELNPAIEKSFIPKEVSYPNIDKKEISNLIKAAKRPLLLVGGGCRDFKEELNALIEKWNLPVVCSLMGKGIINEDYCGFVGMIGSYGNRNANMVVSQCDLLIALGTRLDTRQTGARLESFMPEGRIIFVNIDDGELNCHRLKNIIPINTDVNTFIEVLWKIESPCLSEGWMNWISKIKSRYSQDKEIERFVANKAPYQFMQLFNEISFSNSIITTDVGQNQMWAAQTIRIKKGQEFITSGGLAPMGISMPIAIGMAFASPDKTIYCFNGDGGFQMASQSLLLISQYQLNIKVIVMNNNALGMITQFQHLYFNDRMVATTAEGGYLTPDIKAMAKAYHLNYESFDENNLNKEKLSKALKKKSIIVDFHISGITVVSPKLEYNQPICNPSPFLPVEELQAVLQ